MTLYAEREACLDSGWQGLNKPYAAGSDPSSR